MERKNRILTSELFRILLIAVPVSVILNWSAASSLVGTLVGAVEPIFYGIAIALILNSPVSRLEKHIGALDRGGRIPEGTRTWIALILVLAVIAAVVYAVVTFLVPQIVRMFEAVVAYLQTNDLQERIRGFLHISEEDWNARAEGWLGNLSGMIGTYIREGVSSVLSATSSFLRLLIALTLAMYILASRHSLHRQFRRVTNALLPGRTASLINHTASLSVETVSTWFGHQMLEGIIFGCVMAAVMLILGLPYVIPVSFLSACLYMLPYVGSWLTFFQGFLIMLSVDLRTAVIFSLMLLILQTLDGNVLNPHLVGGSVGLPPWLALAAISFFGAVFGLPGMFLGVPASAVIFALLKETVRSREREKKERAEEDSCPDAKAEGPSGE